LDAWQPIPDDPEEFEIATPMPNEQLQQLRDTLNQKPRTRLQTRLAAQNFNLINQEKPITDGNWAY